MRKPTVWVSDQVRHNLACTVTEEGKKLEISDLGRRGFFSICVAKTKAQISCAVTAQLIRTFVFSHGRCWFSHDSSNVNDPNVHINDTQAPLYT